MIADSFARAHADAQKAVRVFLPSLYPLVPSGPQVAQPVPPRPNRFTEATRTMSLARHVEGMSKRVARGLPPTQPQPTPLQQFGAELDPVHLRALSAAIAAHPEEQRAALLHEAHESLVKWIATNNGKVVIDGHMELAHSPQTAETLAARIINGAVDDHDQRKIAAAQAAQPPADSVRRESRTEPSHAPAVPPDGTGGAPAATTQPTPGVSSAVSSASPRDDGRAPAALPAAPSGAGVDADRVPGNGAAQHPPGLPEIVPPGDGKPPAQGAPPQVKPEEAAKVGTRQADGHLRTQPKNSVAANQKLALEAAPELHAALGQLASQVPGARFDRLRPQKATERLGQKVEDDNQPNTLSDYLGAQIAADTPQAKDKLIDLLRQNFKVIEVDDQFLQGRQDKAGYPSANVQVQLGNGVSAEVQIVPKEVQDRTEESHKFYKAGREAEVNGDHEERDRQWAQAKAIHNEALDRFKARNAAAGAKSDHEQAPPVSAPVSSSSAPPGYQVLGEPIRIGSQMFLRVQSAPGGPPQSPAPPADPPQATEADAEHPDDAATPAGRAGSPAPPSPAESPAAAAIPAATPVPGTSGSPRADSTLQKGSRVTLRDGREGEVQFVHPSLNIARVRVDGKVLTLNPTTDLDVSQR